MIILHVIPTLDPKSGGVCQAVRNIVKYSISSENPHHVVCLDNDNENFLINDKLIFTVHALGGSFTPWNYNGRLVSWLRANLYKFDRVVVHGLWQYQSLAIRICWENSKKNGSKLCIMPHGMLDPYFQKSKGRKLKAIRNYLIWEIVERSLLKMADTIFYTCEIERQLAQKSFRNYQPSLEQIVGLGVESPPRYTDQMNRAFLNRCPEIDGKKYFLFLSRINPKKGIDLLIRAYLSLKETVNYLPILIVAGPGMETDFGRDMLKLANNDKHILFPGMLAGEAKWGCFYNSEAFVLPSHQENFGIATVEAMACGVSVLISDQINIYREVANHEAGLVEHDTYDGVLKMLTTWTALSPTEKSRYKSNALACYQKNFSPVDSGAQFISALKY